jgi:hypothetical protein
MRIFKKLFGNSNGGQIKSDEQNNSIPKEHIKIKRSIFDFFQLDIKNMPDDSFIAAETEINTSGEKIENFRKTLNYKECGIFDTVEIKVIGEERNKNVFLKSFQPQTVKMDTIKRLIDDLYLLHGNDCHNKGKFTNKDIADYNSAEFYMLFGRTWSEYPKYKFPVAVGRDEDQVSISIWGVSGGE